MSLRVTSWIRTTGRTALRGEPTVWLTGVGVFLPVRDGAGADAEESCGEVSVPAEEVLDLEDPKSLHGGVVGTTAVGELVESGTEDLDDLPGEL
jgi:hypothetical protein